MDSLRNIKCSKTLIENIINHYFDKDPIQVDFLRSGENRFVFGCKTHKGLYNVSWWFYNKYYSDDTFVGSTLFSLYKGNTVYEFDLDDPDFKECKDKFDTLCRQKIDELYSADDLFNESKFDEFIKRLKFLFSEY